MHHIAYDQVVTDELLKGNIDNNGHHGFLEDYRVLHCLLRTYNPKSVFEIGTNRGTGTNIICNALPKAKVYSLDLPTELAHTSLQHPISEGKGDVVGIDCKRPFKQLRGDSLHFGYQDYPAEAYWVDAEHTYRNVLHETGEIVNLFPKLIVWHDSDIEEVYQAIVHAMDGKPYNLYRVTDTRIAYALIWGV